MPASIVTLEQYFWQRVDKNGTIPENRPELGPCWLWTGNITARGYGMSCHGGKQVFAHIVGYELFNGPKPEGTDTDHLCRNHPCCRYSHLEAVPHKTNVLRGLSPIARNAFKTHCDKGHELTPDNVKILAGGGRRCIACRRIWTREWQRKRYIPASLRMAEKVPVLQP